MRFLILIIITLLFLQIGCGSEKIDSASADSKELLVFCGITMIDPIMKLSELFEKKYSVSIKMTYGGSKDLAKSIEVNHLGDIYFPGTVKFVEEMQAKGHIVDQCIGRRGIGKEECSKAYDKSG
jgi:molybdate transport system substrate-binding protein